MNAHAAFPWGDETVLMLVACLKGVNVAFFHAQQCVCKIAGVLAFTKLNLKQKKMRIRQKKRPNNYCVLVFRSIVIPGRTHFFVQPLNVTQNRRSSVAGDAHVEPPLGLVEDTRTAPAAPHVTPSMPRDSATLTYTHIPLHFTFFSF